MPLLLGLLQKSLLVHLLVLQKRHYLLLVVGCHALKIGAAARYLIHHSLRRHYLGQVRHLGVLQRLLR